MRTQSPLSRSETRFLHTLYQSYAGPLYRVAHHRLGDPYLAQDLVQTVFLAAAEKLPTLRRHENPWAWLLRALHYELSHTYTKLARERQRLCPLDQAEATTSAPPPTLGLADILPAQLTDREREILLYTTKRACPTRRSQRILRSPSPPAAPGSPAPKSTAAPFSPPGLL